MEEFKYKNGILLYICDLAIVVNVTINILNINRNLNFGILNNIILNSFISQIKNYFKNKWYVINLYDR